MKKISIFITLFIVIIGSIWFLVAYFSSFQKINFTVKNPSSDISYVLFNGVIDDHGIKKTGDQIETFTDSQEYKLKKGSYVLEPKGEHIVTTPLVFTLSESPLTQIVDVPYTNAYLEEILNNEQASITEAINVHIPELAGSYSIPISTLYGRGEWYGALLTNNYGYETYTYGDDLRLLMHKENGNWRVLTEPPQITLNTIDYPDTPREILKSINEFIDPSG